MFVKSSMVAARFLAPGGRWRSVCLEAARLWAKSSRWMTSACWAPVLCPRKGCCHERVPHRRAKPPTFLRDRCRVKAAVGKGTCLFNRQFWIGVQSTSFPASNASHRGLLPKVKTLHAHGIGEGHPSNPISQQRIDNHVESGGLSGVLPAGDVQGPPSHRLCRDKGMLKGANSMESSLARSWLRLEGSRESLSLSP